MARRRRDDDEDDDDLPKKKASRRDDDYEDDDLDEDLDPAAPPPARSNAYTGILSIAFVALVAAAVIFYLDASELSSAPIPQPNVSVPGLGEEKVGLPVTPPGK